jgi:hypothetical protein
MARDISIHFFLNPPPIKGFRPKNPLDMNLFSCGIYFALVWTEPKKIKGYSKLETQGESLPRFQRIDHFYFSVEIDSDIQRDEA